MFKNMKLSQRISFGFISILLIAVLLGVMAIFNMTRSGSNAKQLDNEFIPAVEIAVKLDDSIHNVMLNVRSYGLAESVIYYDDYVKENQTLEAIIAEFEKLAERTQNIPELKNNINEVKNAAKEYETMVNETKKINETLEELRTTMDESAKQLMVEANAYLASQNQKIIEETNANKGAAVIKERLNKISKINNVINSGNNIRVENFKAQALRDLTLISNVMSNFVTINEELQGLKSVTTQEVNYQQLDKIKIAGDNYKNALIQFETTWKARTEFEKIRTVKANEMLAALDKISSLGLQKTKTIAGTTNASLTASTVIMIIGLTIAVILGMALSFVIISSITKSINKIVGSLKTGAEQVYQASEQLSIASQSLAEGSSEQAAAIEETSSTLDETSSMVQQNTENTKQASVLSNNAKESAEKGNKEMEEMMTAMSEIKASSSQISKIIKVIDDIAFQTNILALNAAVEAAGAGDAGMGFAVVAEEVRNLAQRSAQAAKDTAEMIETSIVRADKGADIVGKVAHSLSEIREQAKKVNEIMNEITTASQEQSQGIFQINKAVNQMEQVTQSIASGAEESASSSEELSAQAESLMEIVSSLIELVDGAGAAKTSVMKINHRMDIRNDRNYHSKSINRSKKSSHEFSPETIIPLNEDSTDF